MAEREGVVLRRTPYELVFGPERFEAEVFPAIAAEAESRQPGRLVPETFIMLGTVGNLLRDLRPGETGQSPPAEAIRQYGSLTWQAWSFWRAGRPAGAVPESVVRAVHASPGPGAWSFRPPAIAGYLQLPRHRFWTRVDEAGPAEPLDGFHWTWLEADPVAGRASPRIDLLLALGVRPGRGGLSVIEVSATPPPGPAAHWAGIDARESGTDFENILPGGGLQGYLGIGSVAEVLKLVSRCFYWIETHGFEEVPAPQDATVPESVDDMPDSELPFRRVAAAAEDGGS